MRKRSILGLQRNTAKVEHRQHIAVAKVVLQREAKHVELGKRREGFQPVKRQTLFSQQLLHVGRGGECPLARPIVAPIHHVVEHLQPVVAHSDRVGIGKGQAEGAANLLGVFGGSIPFATRILGRRQNPGKHVIDNSSFQGLIQRFSSQQCSAKPVEYGAITPV